MTGKTDNGTSERELINHVLAVIEERLANAISEAEFRDPDFVRRRFGEVLADLEMAHDTIADLTNQLYGNEGDPVPGELRHALRSHGRRLRPVHLDIGGIPRTVMVPPQGRDDPGAAARLWRRLQERYGGEGSK